MQTGGLPVDGREVQAACATTGTRRQRPVAATGDFAQQLAAFHPFVRDPAAMVPARGAATEAEDHLRTTAAEAGARLKRRRQER